MRDKKCIFIVFASLCNVFKMNEVCDSVFIDEFCQRGEKTKAWRR